MKTIICDIDGVMLNFTKSWLKFVNEKLNKNIKYEDCIDFDMSLYIPNSKNLYKEFIKTDEIGKLEFYEDMLSLFNRIYDSEKYHIVMLTAMISVEKQKRIDNLKRLKYHELIFDTEKSKYVSIYNPEFIFEDCPFLIDSYLQTDYNFKLYIPQHPWNFKNIFKDNRVFKYNIKELINLKELQNLCK